MKKLNFKKIGLIIRNNYVTNRSLPLILFAVVLVIGCLAGSLPTSSVESSYAYSKSLNVNSYESYVYTMKRTYEDLTGFDGAFSILFIIMALVLPFLSTLSVNGFMRDKSGNDFYHSLSVNRCEMFLANYLTVLVNSAVTIIVSQLGGILLMDMIAEYKPMSLLQLLAAQLPVIGAILLFLALFTAISMIATICAGTVFASIVNYAFINFYIPATILAVSLSGNLLFDSHLMDYLDHYPHPYVYTSPFIRYILGCFEDGIPFAPLTFILVAVATVLLIITGIRIYTVKKNENSFKPLPFTPATRPIQYLLTFDAILLGATFFNAITDSFIWCIVGMLLALFFSFIAFNAFANKSFNGVLKNTRHMAFILVITLLAGSVFVADIFHIYKEPEMNPDKIDSCYLHVTYQNEEYNKYNSYDFVEELDDGYKYGTEINEEIRKDLADLWTLLDKYRQSVYGTYEDKEAISVSINVSCENDFSRYHNYIYVSEVSTGYNEIKAIVDKFAENYNKSGDDIYYHEKVTAEPLPEKE